MTAAKTKHLSAVATTPQAERENPLGTEKISGRANSLALPGQRFVARQPILPRAKSIRV